MTKRDLTSLILLLAAFTCLFIISFHGFPLVLGSAHIGWLGLAFFAASFIPPLLPRRAGVSQP